MSQAYIDAVTGLGRMAQELSNRPIQKGDKAKIIIHTAQAFKVVLEKEGYHAIVLFLDVIIEDYTRALQMLEAEDKKKGLSDQPQDQESGTLPGPRWTEPL